MHISKHFTNNTQKNAVRFKIKQKIIFVENLLRFFFHNGNCELRPMAVPVVKSEAL